MQRGAWNVCSEIFLCIVGLTFFGPVRVLKQRRTANNSRKAQGDR